jgi:NhaA family Na+:H+ antiporter
MGSLAQLLRTVRDNSLGLLIGAVTGLIWANIGSETYHAFAHPLHFLVNDVGMVFFFALAMKEIVEATLPGGALASPRRAAVPLLAAAGGMVGPAAIFTALALGFGHDALVRGWAVPCATDIAFSYLVARWIFGPKHPAVPFLLLLAIADDALGLLILAVFYPSGPLRPLEAGGLLAIAIAIAAMLKARRRDFVGGAVPRRVASGAGAGSDRPLHPARAARSGDHVGSRAAPS